MSSAFPFSQKPEVLPVFIFYPYSNAETLLQEDIYMSIKIAITNEKGGCGKTTSAVNISAILAERGYRVLLAELSAELRNHVLWSV